MNRVLTFWLAVLMVFLGGMVFYFAGGRSRPAAPVEHVSTLSETDEHHLTSGNAEAAAGGQPIEFELTNQEGQPFASTSLAGKIWVGSIFYASCPSMCRLQNMRVAELQKEFGSQGVEFVSITCDPANDTPARLKEYGEMYGAQDEIWHFLTGDLDLIRKIGGQRFGITVDDKVHSDRLVLFHRDGSLVKSYRSLEADQFAELQSTLREMLGASPQTAPVKAEE